MSFPRRGQKRRAMNRKQLDQLQLNDYHHQHTTQQTTQQTYQSSALFLQLSAFSHFRNGVQIRSTFFGVKTGASLLWDKGQLMIPHTQSLNTHSLTFFSFSDSYSFSYSSCREVGYELGLSLWACSLSESALALRLLVSLACMNQGKIRGKIRGMVLSYCMYHLLVRSTKSTICLGGKPPRKWKWKRLSKPST